MKTYWYTVYLLALSFLFNSCNKDNNIDTEKPQIDISIPCAFPLNCDTLYFGEPFELQLLFTDNAELGSTNAFSIDIHNNFKHHTHSTDVSECRPEAEKEPINPFLFIENYDIPAGQSSYQTNQTISIPSGNENGQYDEGDYHFFISLADKEGWSTQKGLSIKMRHP